MRLYVIDTETSDLDPGQGATILELAWMELTHRESIQGKPDYWEPTNYSRSYIQYSGPINPHAQASHHIRSDSLTKDKGAISRADAVGFLLKNIDDDVVCVAHNSDFDARFLPEVKRPWICTFRSAKHVWPNAPGYSNQVLRYWLNVDFPQDILALAPIVAHQHPHQALYDVATTTGILRKMLERYTKDQLLFLSKSPVRLKTINFGKHKGLKFEEIPRDYLVWLRSQGNLDDDLRHTIDSILKS